MRLEIATWNMGHWQYKGVAQEAWDYLLNAINPDIALVQEARLPDELTSDYSNVWREIGGDRNWGSGILARGLPIVEVAFENTYPGALIVADVTLQNGLALTVSSMYGLIDEWTYAITTLHRMLSDLTPLLVGKMGKRTFVFGGDLNASVQIDEQQRGRSHHIFFERFEDFGLTNCHFMFHDDHLQTLRHARSKSPWHNDYFLVSDEITDNVAGYEIIDDEGIYHLSDHNPVVIGLEFD